MYKQSLTTYAAGILQLICESKKKISRGDNEISLVCKRMLLHIFCRIIEIKLVEDS